MVCLDKYLAINHNGRWVVKDRDLDPTGYMVLCRKISEGKYSYVTTDNKKEIDMLFEETPDIKSASNLLSDLHDLNQD